MTERERFRYRLTFHKTEAMRFIGHLDLYRSLERSIRRAGLPMAYRSGFHPHARLQLASALPLGFTSRAELADLWLEQPVGEAEVLAMLQAASPPGLHFVDARIIVAAEPALQEQVTSATFSAILAEPPTADLEQRIQTLLSAASLSRPWRNKEHDLRPLVERLEIAGPGQLLMRLAARQGATGRPDEVLEALGLDPLAARIERTALTLAAGPAT
jgi:radical SAM-linked protein